MRNNWQAGFFSKLVDTKFFTLPTHPVNLAIFRIVFAIVSLLQIPWEKTMALAAWPASLRFPPKGLEWFVSYVPISPELASTAAYIYYFCCFLLLIGFCTRSAAFGVALTAFYVLGIKTFFGSVSHAQHHVVLFALVLSLSRSADVLSIDAILKKGDHREEDWAEASAIYTVPIRIIWILMGTIYFFPGYWKLVYSGMDWALGDNIKFQMYHKWYWFDWTPFFRIDEYPALFHLAGLWTLFFETSFIFLLFVPKLRFVPVVMGFLFHIFTAIFMRIQFWGLASCYVVFLNWHQIFMRVGKRLFVQPLCLRYHKDCRACSYFIKVVRAFDVFERIDFIGEAIVSERFPPISGNIGSHELHNKRLLWNIIIRAPFLFFMLPLLLIPSNYLKNWHKASALCIQKDARISLLREKRKPAVPLYFFCGLIIAGQLLSGFTQTMNGWPFSCYPTFRKIKGPINKVVDLKLYDKNQKLIDSKKLGRKGNNIRQLLEKIVAVKDPEERREKIEEFFSVFRRNYPRLRKVAAIEVYMNSYLVYPENFKDGPVKSKRIAVYDIGDARES